MLKSQTEPNRANKPVAMIIFDIDFIGFQISAFELIVAGI